MSLFYGLCFGITVVGGVCFVFELLGLSETLGAKEELLFHVFMFLNIF